MNASAWLSVLLFLQIISSGECTSQPWNYNFGTVVDSLATGVSTSFLPSPPVGGARIRIGSQGGSVALVSPGHNALGSGSELHLHAPSGGSLNKVQFHSMPQASAFTIRLSFLINGAAGTYYVFTGAGACFQNNSGFSSAEVFTGLRLILDSTGAVTAALREPSGWTTLPPGTCRSDTVHTLELYCNNRSNSVTYTHDSSCVLAAHCLDLWIDGRRVAHDRAKTGLPDTTLISAFMFYAAYSPGNSSCFSVDDIDYTNDIASVPLPVELSSFTIRDVGTQTRLQWITETELNNHGFTIERRCESDAFWRDIGFVPGYGDTQAPQLYSWTDSAPCTSGQVCYRLRQVDRDGAFSFSEVECIEIDAGLQGGRFDAPWPQPARDVIHLPYDRGPTETVSIRITTLTGVTVAMLSEWRILPADGGVITLPCAAWPRGVLLYILERGNTTKVTPFILI